MDGRLCIHQSRYHCPGEVWGGNSQEAIIKAANHAQGIREECLAGMKSMAFETVFSIPEKVQFVKRAKEAGFFNFSKTQHLGRYLS